MGACWCGASVEAGESLPRVGEDFDESRDEPEFDADDDGSATKDVKAEFAGGRHG